LQTYRDAYKQLTSFLQHLNRPATLPISERNVAAYVAHIATTIKVPAIKSKLAAIAWQHRIEGFPDPTKSFRIARILAGKQKNTRAGQDKLKPLSFEVLAQMLPQVKAVTNGRFEKTLFKAVFTLAYSACLRVSEYAISNNDEHTLRVDNVYFIRKREEYKIKIILNTFKHSKSQETLYIDPQADSTICPIRALQIYLRIRPAVPGPLFIHKNMKPITRNAVSQVLRAAIGRTGLDPTEYAPHSLRIGRATDLARQNTPEHIIKKTGRWNSTAYLKYIRLENFHVPLPPKA